MDSLQNNGFVLICNNFYFLVTSNLRSSSFNGFPDFHFPEVPFPLLHKASFAIFTPSLQILVLLFPHFRFWFLLVPGKLSLVYLLLVAYFCHFSPYVHTLLILLFLLLFFGFYRRLCPLVLHKLLFFILLRSLLVISFVLLSTLSSALAFFRLSYCFVLSLKSPSAFLSFRLL